MPELNNTILKNSANLKAYYRFESGAETTDSSGNSNTLTAIGTPTYSAGKFGQSVDLASASSQAFSIVDNSVLKPTGAFSIGGWIKTSTASVQLIFQSYSQNTNVAGIQLYIDASGQPNFLSGRNTGTVNNTDYKFLTSSTAINNGNWRFLVATWDGATMRIYIDGAHNTSVAWANAPGYAATNYVRVGCSNNSGSNSQFFNGSLDDVFLVNGTALSADQIKELYEGRTLGEGWPQSGLVGGWHLNGNSTDFSGNNNHGTDTAVTYSLANGKFNQGAGFVTASNSKIAITDAATLKPTVPFTVSGWVKTTTSGSASYIFQSYSANTNNAGIRVLISSVSNSIYFSSGNNTGTVDGTNFKSINGTKAVNDGLWHHFVCVWDGATLLTYIDGALNVSAAWNTAPAYAATNYVRFGCTNTAGVDGNFLTGSIDEIAVYNVAKSADWVRKQYAWSVGKYL